MSLLRLLETFFRDETQRPASGAAGRVQQEDDIILEDLEKISTGFSLENGVKLEIYKGDLVTAKVDIIVNSTASHMALSSGKVAAALLNAAGPGLQKECDAVKPLPLGDIVMTNGYRLNCANVLHVNCPAWDTQSSDKVLEKLISKCLLWTKDNSARSIAFPAIGTGLLRFPPDVVAESFVRAAAKFAKDNEDTTVERIIMIVYDKDSVTQQGFEKALDLKIKAMPTIKSSDSKQPIDGEGKFVRSVPETWEKPLNVYREFGISKHTLEWKNVSSSFLKTIGKPAGEVAVLDVRRVQNPKSYFLYDSNRAFVAQKLSRREDQVETTPLWHATAEENIQKITHGKFDRRLSGKIGGNLLGPGCYFSTTSKYSDGWNSPVNAAGEKHMIMVRVVTGEYCKGNGSLKTAPYKPGSETEQYDSVVDDVSNPTKYVVYHDASAYPEYIVKYKL